ncbi:MAG: hypothetical protein VW709_07135 [Rickettsiales bacterium]|jgi:hypothetical protein
MKRLLPILFLTLAFGATGCGALDTIFQERYSEHAPTETKVLTRPWFERDKPTNLEPVYCYKTLVELECYDKARPGDERPAVWTYQAVKP